MANVEAPAAEAKKVFEGYSDVTSNPIVFSITVYLNMPSSNCSAPKTQYNPNNYLKTLAVTDINGKDLSLTPTFDILTTTDFTLVVDRTCEIINIATTTVSSKATVLGNGSYVLAQGVNNFEVSVVAQNGDIRRYNITIVRES